MLAAEGGVPGSGHDRARGDDLIAAARTLADDVLAPAAEAIDRAPAVAPEYLGALARAGLFGLAGPPEHGGHAAPTAVVREVYEALAGASGATFFVWVQHHAPVRLLAGSPNDDLRQHLLPALCSGAQLGAVAFAHLRRPGPPAVVARRSGDDIVVDGEAPWVTSWGMADTVAVAALVDPATVVYVAVPARETASVRPSPPLALAAMEATSTVRLAFDGLRVGPGEVICELPLDGWRARDRLATAKPHPAAFGVAATCTRLLAQRDGKVATSLEEERCALRERAYALADEDRDDPEHIDALVALRARSLELTVRAATALVVATGGRAMSLDHPAQRLVREAVFYTIQAQTPALRAATLARLTGVS